MSIAKPIYALNGPNLNFPGVCALENFGRETRADIGAKRRARAEELSAALTARHPNCGGAFVGRLQEARDKASAVVLNADAFSHTSIAPFDAIKAIDLPVIQTHLSNPAKRAPFRVQSHIASGAQGVMAGFGPVSSRPAIEAAASLAQARAAGAQA